MKRDVRITIANLAFLLFAFYVLGHLIISINSQIVPHVDELEIATGVYDFTKGEPLSGYLDYNAAFAIHQGLGVKSIIPILTYQTGLFDLITSVRLIGVIIFAILLFGAFLFYKYTKYSPISLIVITYVLYEFMNNPTTLGYVRLIVNAETQIDTVAFVMLALVLMPKVLRSKNIIFLTSYGLILGLGFSLGYFMIPAILALFFIGLGVKENRKRTLENIKEWLGLIGGFVIGIMPWIVLGLATEFYNLTYRGMSFIDRSSHLDSNLIRILYQNEIISVMPIWSVILFYCASLYGIYILIRNKGKSGYITEILKISSITHLLFILFSTLCIVSSNDGGHLVFEYAMFLIPLMIISISSFAILLYEKFIPYKVPYQVFFPILILLIFIVFPPKFMESNIEGQLPDVLYTTPEGVAHNLVLYREYYQTPEQLYDFCLQMESKVLQKYCFLGLTYRGRNDNLVDRFNQLETDLRKWLYSHTVYWYHWNGVESVVGKRIEDRVFLNELDVPDKDILFAIFKERGECANNYRLNKEFNWDAIADISAECMAGICMGYTFEAGMNQFTTFPRFDQRRFNADVGNLGPDCQAGVEFYANDFKEIYGVDLI